MSTLVRYGLALLVAISLTVIAGPTVHANGLFHDTSLGTGDTLSEGSCTLSFVYSSYYFSGTYFLNFDCASWDSIIDGDVGYPVGTHSDQWGAEDSGGVLYMGADGNCVMYNSSNEAEWATNTGGNSEAYLNVQADGNLVVYSATDIPLWALN